MSPRLLGTQLKERAILYVVCNKGVSVEFVLFVLFMVAVVAAVSKISEKGKTVSTSSSFGGFSFQRLSKKTWLQLAIAFAVLVGIFSTVSIVPTGKIAVVTRFGKVTSRELGEGIHIKLPIEQVVQYDIKVQKEESDARAASKDLQDINSKLVINFKLQPGEIKKIHQTIGKDYNVKLISPAVQEVFKATTAKFDATELITDRAQVKNDSQTMLEERLSKYGIILIDVSITDFQFSQEFIGAIENKQIAQQNAERAKFNLEASKTDAEAQRAQSETLSALFLQKQAIEKWDGKLPQYLGGESVFNLPLK